MTTHIALLRAVNVGGRNLVAMAGLRAMLTRLGFGDPRSLLQSGNLVFESTKRHADVEALLEAGAKRHLGLDTAFFVRSTDEWRAVVARNPFPREAARDPGRLLVMFLKDAPGARAVDALRSAIRGPELVRARGRHAYLVYPNGTGRSRVTTALIEGKLGTRGTGRNWNTVLKLESLARA